MIWHHNKVCQFIAMAVEMMQAIGNDVGVCRVSQDTRSVARIKLIVPALGEMLIELRLDGSVKSLQLLPPITGEQLREAAGTYKEHTGRGCDAFHPKWFAWLSDELLAAFALLLMSLEKLGVWPSQISAILIALIPKNSGGTRPIGLLAALVRLWERVRKPIVAEWRRTVERSYN